VTLPSCDSVQRPGHTDVCMVDVPEAGLQENHIRYLSPSLSTDTSKQTPRLPPRTGL
jgi:hypothetical protein